MLNTCLTALRPTLIESGPSGRESRRTDELGAYGSEAKAALGLDRADVIDSGQRRDYVRVGRLG